MKRLFTAFLCVLFLFLSPVTAYATTTGDSNDYWPQGPNVFAEAAIVMEASTGLVLYEKNIHKTYYPASITKIITALLAIENSSLNEIVTFSRDAVFNVELTSSRIGIDVGEQLTMQQCLYGILLESANEVTYATAEHIGGSIPEFAAMMNQRAKEIGAKNTNFVNPHGLPDDEHVTTAYDMALITREAMKNETFRKITGTRTSQIPPTNIQKETRYLRNHHRFILKQDYRYDDAIGGKTGYTTKAKFTLVTIAKRGDMELICVILKDDSQAHQYQDTQKLLDYGFDNFSIYSIADLEEDQTRKENPLFTRYNPLLNKSESPLTIDEKGYLILPNSASYFDAKKEVSFHDLQSSNQSQDVVGSISYTYNDKYVGGANIILNESNNISLTKEPFQKDISEDSSVDDTISEKKGSLKPMIIGFIIGFFALIFLLYYIFVERPRIKRRNAYYRKRKNRRKYDNNDFIDF